MNTSSRHNGSTSGVNERKVARGNQNDPLGHITTYGYDAAGNQISVQDALGRITTSSCDGNRRLLTVTDAKGGVTSHAYDGKGNHVRMIESLGRTTSYVYDHWENKRCQEPLTCNGLATMF